MAIVISIVAIVVGSTGI